MPGTTQTTGKTARRGPARLAVAATLAAAGVLAAAQAASASWLDQPTPVVSGATAWSFGAVSCTAAGSCMAVGNSDASSGGLLAESGAAGQWTVLTVPDPGGGNFSSVSCTSSSACTAVGDYNNGTDTVTLAERWNGASWSVQATPNPAGATSSVLNRVACTSATACTAVGDSVSGSATSTLAEAWNGTSWSVQATPNASGEASSQLNGISCPSAASCTAVGSSASGPDTVPLAERWNGTSWSIQATPSPSGPTYNPLQGVSCAAASACTAVGAGFAERWNGTSWSVQAIARTKDNLASVSCAAAADCTAVGAFYKGGIQYMAAESLGAGRWKVDSTPISTSFDTDALYDVSCTAIHACTAVGSYHDPVNGNRPLVEVLRLRWQPQQAPVPPGAIATGLQAVSCAAVKACMAVGNYEGSDSTFDTFTESWNGSGWTIQSPPNAANSNLSGVSCTSASACTAVGDVFSGPDLVTLAERWNGTSWTVQVTPSPATAVNSYLTSVSCTSATACTAVGFYVKGSGDDLPLAESWNGSSWTMHTAPNPSGTTYAQLEGVSCASASACVAVGSFHGTGDTSLAEIWNGTSWKIHSPPLPGGGSGPTLAGVSCTAATACTAVGDYFNGTAVVTLAERWDGTGWAAQASPNAPRATDSYLAAVSCTSATSCWTTGSAYHRHGAVKSTTLAEHWNGSSWAVTQPGQVSGAPQSDLTGVSCRSTINCMGVGWYYDAASTEYPLAAPYN